MTWRPTEGLKRAERIVRRLQADSASADLELRDEVFAHHMITVLTDAFDATAFASSQPALDLGPEAPPVSAYENGGGEIDLTPKYWPADQPLPSQGFAGMPASPASDNLQAVVDAAVDLGQHIEKRKRGRPKGSGKKAKPGRKPKADPIEAVAEALKEGEL